MSIIYREYSDFIVVYYEENDISELKTDVGEERTLLEKCPIVDQDLSLMQTPDGTLVPGCYYVAEPLSHPYNKCGYLSSKSTKGYSHGSGQFVKNKNFVLTAAHCIFNRESGEFYTTLRFGRAYPDAYDGYPIKLAVFPKQYMEKNSTDFRKYDYAVLITDRSTDETPLDYETHNANPGDSVLAVGYPEKGMMEYTMYFVTDIIGTDSQAQGFYTLENTRCMTEGSSGGAWLTLKNDSYKVIGLTSFGMNGNRVAHSPMLGTNFEAMFSVAEKVLDELNEALASKEIRMFSYVNDGAAVTRIQVLYTSPGSKEQKTYKHDREICCLDDNVCLDLADTSIPDGSVVKFKVDVVAGIDNVASEEFIYRISSKQCAKYRFTGTTIFGNDLSCEVVCITDL